jgi:hypothetical protein
MKHTTELSTVKNMLALPVNLLLTMLIRWCIAFAIVRPLTNLWLRRSLERARRTVGTGVARGKLLAHIAYRNTGAIETLVLTLLGLALGLSGFQLIGLAFRRRHWLAVGSMNVASLLGFMLRSTLGGV